MAWEVKDFLVSQQRCVDVTVEGQVFPGKAAKKDNAKDKQKDTVGKKKSKSKTESHGNHAGGHQQELWLAQTALYFFISVQ